MTSDSYHETVVVMTGSLLSSLMVDNLQPGGEKEGFLLGKLVLQTVQVNNDVQSNVPLQQKRIVLSDFLSCDRVGEFYSNTGRLADDKLTSLFDDPLVLQTVQVNNDVQSNVPLQQKRIVLSDFLSCDRVGEFYSNTGRLADDKLTSLFDDPDLVVGWYRFRRRCPCRPSLRERIVHVELCRRRPRTAATGAGFVFLLMTDNVVEMVVRHEQKALMLRDGSLHAVRLEVANLGGTGGGRYRTTAFGQLGPLLPGATDSLADRSALSAALAVQGGAAQQLRSLLDRLERSESDTAAAYREVEELKLQLADRQAAER